MSCFGFIPNIQTGVVHGWATRRGAAVQKQSADEHRPLHLLTWLLTPTRSRATGSRAVPAGADDAPAAELNAAGWLVPKAIGAVVTGPG